MGASAAIGPGLIVQAAGVGAGTGAGSFFKKLCTVSEG
jgi:hypothetical protein